MNIVLVIFDTLRRDHLGAYGNDWIHTPHLDAFAGEAVRFTRAYPESLPTLPFRRAIHTGLRTYPFHGHRECKGDFIGAPGWGPIPEEQDTVAERLREAGYRTALLTDCYHQFKPSKNFHRGFDEWDWIRGQETDRFRSGPALPAGAIRHHVPERFPPVHQPRRGRLLPGPPVPQRKPLGLRESGRRPVFPRRGLLRPARAVGAAPPLSAHVRRR